MVWLYRYLRALTFAVAYVCGIIVVSRLTSNDGSFFLWDTPPSYVAAYAVLLLLLTPAVLFMRYRLKKANIRVPRLSKCDWLLFMSGFTLLCAIRVTLPDEGHAGHGGWRFGVASVALLLISLAFGVGTVLFCKDDNAEE
jgi:membrane protease YdiL (CAAX protease family)